MLKMHEKAKEKGITAIIGIGASPGITVMLARVAMQQLDTVDTVYTGSSLDGASADAASSQTGSNAAMGTKDWVKASAGASFSSEEYIRATSMGEATGIPLACGLKLLLDGKIKGRGVFAPEGAIEPHDFFNVLKAIGMAKILGNANIIKITNNWQLSSQEMD